LPKITEASVAFRRERRGAIRQTIIISELEVVRFDLPVVEVRMRCSKGTYVRAFARDLGLANQSGGCLIGLRRTAIGGFRVEKAMSPELFEQIVS
jgi:tRNA pseudouridine55 synthase